MKTKKLFAAITAAVMGVCCLPLYSHAARSIPAREFDENFRLNRVLGISDLVMTEEDFEEYAAGTPASEAGFTQINDITDASVIDDGGNKCIEFGAISSGDAYMRYPFKKTMTGLAVVEMDFKVPGSLNLAHMPAVMGNDSQGAVKEAVVIQGLSPTSSWAVGGANQVDFNAGEWVRISMAIDLNNCVSDVYFNGELVWNDLSFYSFIEDVRMLKLICRNEGYRFYIDNIRCGSSDTLSAVDDIPDERENLSFPPQVLAFTDEEVEAQRRAGEKLYEDIEAAIERGDSELVVPDGYYRFGRGKYANLKIEGAENLKIVGNDVNIIEEIIEKAVEVVNCTNLTLQGFRIDFMSLHISQGVVESVNAADESFIFKVDNGYPIPNSGWSNQRLFAYTPDASRPLSKHCNDKVNEIEHLGDKRVRVTTTLGDLFNDGVPFEAGCRVVIPLRTSGGALSVENCGGCTFKDVHVYGSPGFGIYENGGEGGNVYDGLRLIRRPDTNRLHASSADGFHSKGCAVGPQLINSELSYAEDDLLNIHGSLDYVYDIVDKNKLIVVGHYGISAEPGTEVEFYDLESFEYKTSAVVESVQPYSNDIYMENIKDLSAFIESEYNVTLRSMAEGTYSLYTVTLDREVDVLPYDWFIGSSTSSKDTVIRNTYFHDGPVRGALLRAPNTIVEDCVFENIGNAAIYIHIAGYWYEGPFAHGTKIRNNTFKNIVYGSINSVSSIAAVDVITEFFGKRKNPYEAIHYRDIEITDNVIDKCQTAGIAVFNSRDCIIKGNTVSNVFTDWHGNFKNPGSIGFEMKGFPAAIFSENSVNTTMGNNVCTNIPEWCPAELNLSVVETEG